MQLCMSSQRKGVVFMQDYYRSDQSFLKQFNRRKVLDIFRVRDTIARVELSQIANLDKKTITNITRELLNEGLIRFVRTEQHSAGRPKEVLALNGEHAYCIGLDIGGTHITGVLMDFTGAVLASENVDADLRKPFASELFFSICALIMNNLLLKSGLRMEQVRGIGIAIPGHYSTDGHSVLVENTPCLKDVNIQQYFEDRYGKTVMVRDCSQLMALAEMRMGAGRDVSDFLVLDLGLGIGCGIVIDKTIHTGSGGKSGEIGHTIVERDGPPCSCGKNGCIESLASGWALHKQAEQQIVSQPDGDFARIMRHSGDPTTKGIVRAASLGENFSIQLLTNAGVYIGIGVSNAISLLNPARVILGGRMLINNPILLASVQETIREKTMDIIYNETEIVVSNLGPDATAIGAGLQYLDKLYSL